MKLFQSAFPKKATTVRQAVVSVSVAGVLLAGLSTPSFAQENEKPLQGHGEVGKALTTSTQEQVDVKKLSKPDTRRMYVIDARAFESFTQIFSINGETGEFSGQFTTGLLPVLAPSPDGSKLYVADTHYSNYDSGERNDLIRIYDPQTLTQMDTIDIPEHRFFAMSHESYTRVSPDGKYLILYEFAPNNGLGIVDLDSGKYLNNIKTSQCYYVFPTTDRRVVMHCRDGSLLQVTFDKDGKLVNKEQTEPFHKPVEQRIDNEPAFSAATGEIFFVGQGHDGQVYPVDISGDKPEFGDTWDLATQKEREAGWKVGGWQPAAYQAQNNRLYVLMDKRAKWAQNTESRYVWVYDTTTGKKMREIHLADRARSLYVDSGSPAYLYALSSGDQDMTIYNAETGAIKSYIDELGHEPMVATGGAPATASANQ